MVVAVAISSPAISISVTSESGAHERNRTFDLLLTKEVLYRLSYVSRLFQQFSDAVASTMVRQWSGRRESNPRNQFGKLMFYH